MFKCGATNGYIAIYPSGEIRPCCRYNYGPERKTISDFESFEDALTYWDTQFSQKIDWPTGCYKCENEESMGAKSLRQTIHSKGSVFGDFETTGNTIQFLEISVDSVCNFACIMCGPDQSTKWQSLRKDYDFSKYLEFYDRTNEDPDQIKRLIANSDLSRLNTIRLLGGEPFYSRKVREIILYLAEMVDLSKITLTLNTNTSVFPDDEFMNILQKFKRLRIKLSIDATGESAEYSRYGTNWEDVDKNIKQWKKVSTSHHIDLSAAPCITLGTFEHLPETIQYFQDLSLRFQKPNLTWDSYTSITLLDLEYRMSILDKVIPPSREKIIEISSGKISSVKIKNKLLAPVASDINYEHIFNYISKFDTVTGMKFSEISPLTWNQLRKQYEQSKR